MGTGEVNGETWNLTGMITWLWGQRLRKQGTDGFLFNHAGERKEWMVPASHSQQLILQLYHTHFRHLNRGHQTEKQAYFHTIMANRLQRPVHSACA